jgi:hypothetical protein
MTTIGADLMGNDKAAGKTLGYVINLSIPSLHSLH